MFEHEVAADRLLAETRGTERWGSKTGRQGADEGTVRAKDSEELAWIRFNLKPETNHSVKGDSLLVTGRCGGPDTHA